MINLKMGDLICIEPPYIMWAWEISGERKYIEFFKGEPQYAIYLAGIDYSPKRVCILADEGVYVLYHDTLSFITKV